jgi:tRNA A37 N6-isopentenylltransferase MiaA
MTKEEIQKIFGIDITSKNRGELYIFLRAIYANDRIMKKMSYSKIGRELNRTHASVINSVKKFEQYQKDKMFKLVCEAYQTKDKSKIKRYLELNEQRIKSMTNTAQKRSYVRRVVLENLFDSEPVKITPEIQSKYEEIKKIGLFKVIEKLRNHNSSTLWNVPFNKWHLRHWEDFYKL